MAEKSVTDLSYGHPGRATYDPEEKKWIFTINQENEQCIRQISTFKECIPPSMTTGLETFEKPSDESRLQLKELLKRSPELFPGKEILSSLAKLDVTSSGPLIDAGNTLAIGYAFGHNKKLTKIIVAPCGEAGHILRIIRTQRRSLRWESRDGPKISQDQLDLSNQGHWISTGGTIRQVAICGDASAPSTWLAVRQDSMITIFRPYFAEVASSSTSNGCGGALPPSQMNPNPVANLVAEKTGFETHVDISFNPWYTRQFITVNSLGYWSTWFIEKQRSGDLPYHLVKGKHGFVSDGYDANPLLKQTSPEHEDGWHCALWISSLSTIAVCSRQHIAIFDLKAIPKRLRSIELSANKGERILDAKRGSVDKTHMFVLTNSRIIWLEVKSSEYGERGDPGARILLSYRHFRDLSDVSIRLVTVHSDPVCLAIVSCKTPLANLYGFSITPGSLEPACWQGSFVLSMKAEGKSIPAQTLATLSLAPAAPNMGTKPEFQYVDNPPKFLQAWALYSDLALASALCIVHDAVPGFSKLPKIWKTVPTLRIERFQRKLLSKKFVGREYDASITSDYESEVDSNFVTLSRGVQAHHHDAFMKKQTDLRRRIDWTGVFKQVFPSFNPRHGQTASQFGAASGLSIMAGLLDPFREQLQAAKHSRGITMTTLFEVSGQTIFSEELDKATITLHEFLLSLQHDEDTIKDFKFSMSDLSSISALQLPNTSVAQGPFPSFLDIYDQLVDTWMSTLPRQVSVPARLLKHKMIRQIAIDIGLSSVGFSLLESPKISTEDAAQEEAGNELNKLSLHSNDADSGFFSPERTPQPSHDPYYSQSTSTRTPSLYSHAPLASTSELAEDPAISRLRQYAISIETQADLGRSRILSQWEIGDDPENYSWEAVTRASAAENGDEDSRKRRREESRRRRLTESYLSGQASRTRAPTMESQSSPMPMNSQPEFSHQAFSSQTDNGLPMTQPGRGAFGSRTAERGKKKRLRVRNVGF